MDFQPKRPLAPTSTLELSVSCKKLKDKDVMSKSDPVCVLFEQRQGQWVELGRTERVKNDLNPKWQTKFVIDYRFEERQILKFEAYDIDSKSTKLSAHDFLGRIETPLGAIVSAPGKQFTSIIKEGPSKGGQFTIIAEELSACKDEVNIQFAANKLDKKDTFGKSDPYFVLSKVSGNGQYVPLFKSKFIKNTLNPTWEPFNVSVRDLCNGDYERMLKVDVYDHDQKGSHDLIGSFTTNLKGMQAAVGASKAFECINPKKTSKKGYKNSGEVFLRHFFIESKPSFVDYIQGGTALNFSVAIDFTMSNGSPNDPSSLHYRSPQGENQYTTAIRAVGDIISDYDADKHFPALGFGARIPPHGQVSHEFFLNLRTDSPFCAGVDGILQAYYNAIHQVQLYGPTNFSPVINHVARFASTYQDGRQYFVLLIITDGVISDLPDTIDAIVASSDLPMSIIIVGVGDADFGEMEALDADKHKLTSRSGKVATRDIVQFVELQKFLDHSSKSWRKDVLAREVLAEVPNQLVQWMTKRGLKPFKS